MIAFLRELVFKDIWLKLFSLGLAILVWFTLNSMANQKEGLAPRPQLPLRPTEQRTFSNVPVAVISSADDSRAFRINPKQVDVTVQGDPNVVKSLHSYDIRVMVDLTGIEAAHDLRKRIDVSTPAGVTGMRVEPEEVQVVFPPRE
jgi:YbbR domain-containing protein